MSDPTVPRGLSWITIGTTPHVPYWRVNNPTLGEFCFPMIGRADIEGSKSDVAMNAWPPQASYPCGHAFAVCIHTENQNQVSFYPFVLQEISVLFELTLGHLRYRLTDVPPQPNSPPDYVSGSDHRTERASLNQKSEVCTSLPLHRISKKTMKVVVFQCRLRYHLCYTLHVFSQSQTRVKLNRVVFPR
eukprot:sb/3471245/